MVIEEARTVGLPLHHVEYRDLARDFETDWKYYAVTLEEWQDGIRPDIVLYHPDGRLNVEIKVYHAVDEAKAELLRQRVQCKRCAQATAVQGMSSPTALAE
ncbi:Competence protein CoiA OS=Sphingobium scionense OX=1404341 GN=GGQ90_005598 PE=4 SV=1 [Sphingobium scionense]